MCKVSSMNYPVVCFCRAGLTEHANCHPSELSLQGVCVSETASGQTSQLTSCWLPTHMKIITLVWLLRTFQMMLYRMDQILVIIGVIQSLSARPSPYTFTEMGKSAYFQHVFHTLKSECLNRNIFKTVKDKNLKFSMTFLAITLKQDL